MGSGVQCQKSIAWEIVGDDSWKNFIFLRGQARKFYCGVNKPESAQSVPMSAQFVERHGGSPVWRIAISINMNSLDLMLVKID